MPTGCKQAEFAEIAKTYGYRYTAKISKYAEIRKIGEQISGLEGPVLYEIPVTLDSRPDLGRPAESAEKNKEEFMKYFVKENEGI